MIDQDAKGFVIGDLEFQGYAKTTAQLLSSLGIGETTIAKIVDRINQGDNGPLPVYRRAVILCMDGDDYMPKIERSLQSYPLGIVIQPQQIIVIRQAEEPVAVPYDQLLDNIPLFSSLFTFQNNKRDKYLTLEFDQLVESLNRALILNDNSTRDTQTFIFNLLYIVHFSNILGEEVIETNLAAPLKEDEVKLANILNHYQSSEIPFLREVSTTIRISKEAFRYIFAILKFDTRLIDVELLTSLIYRMTNSADSGLFGHQTSFENVNKLLQPFVFDGLQKKIECASKENIGQIIDEIYHLKFFDPTNGPGCFLAAAYSGLNEILKDIEQRFGVKCENLLPLSNFVGLVSNELTKDLTTLALVFAHTTEALRFSNLVFPSMMQLEQDLRISIGDELTEDWDRYVPAQEGVYVIGSPRFLGAHRNLDVVEKEKMQRIFESQTLNSADYCSTWLIKAAKYIGTTPAKAAFVLTNSVSQGVQSTFILDKVNEFGCEYEFAYRSFKWKTSNDNAGVTVVIIGISSRGTTPHKLIVDDGKRIECERIGATLLPNIDIRVKKRKKPLSPYLPEMRKGNMPDGATALQFTSTERDVFLEEFPEAERFIRPLYGGDEFVKSTPRWVLWISDKELEDALKIKGIADRIEIVRATRNAAGSTASEKSRENPHKFRETNMTSKGKVSIVAPCVTSENRAYFQMGILDSKAIVNNNVSVVFDGEIWLLALLESRMHMVWVKSCCGGHETRPRYSSELCYNTFPAPVIEKRQKDILANLSITLLEVRENYCDRSLGNLYTNMPPELARVHSWIDATVDSLYRSRPFESDEERLLWLQNLYNELIENE